MKFPKILGRLCYVEDHCAWFTTCPLDKQWGDDWNDAPYEHNAQQPYSWDTYMTRHDIEPYKLTQVFYVADSLLMPEEGHANSPFSVQDINGGVVPWLRTDAWFQGEAIRIFAGVTFPEFTRLIHQAGGDILIPLKQFLEANL